MPRDRRRNFRAECNLPAIIDDLERRSTWPCSVGDFSNSGAKITGVLALVIPDEFTLRFLHGRTRKCRVRWRLPFSVGVEFTDCVVNVQGLTPDHSVPAALE